MQQTETGRDNASIIQFESAPCVLYFWGACVETWNAFSKTLSPRRPSSIFYTERVGEDVSYQNNFVENRPLQAAPTPTAL